MKRISLLPAQLSALAFGIVALAACNDPFKFDANPVEIPEEETCAASPEWLPDAPDRLHQLDFLPLPHPDSECPFYRGGWQNFLIATRPDPVTGEPAIKTYPTIDDIFDSATPKAAVGTSARSWLGDIKQAGQREILIDQNGHTIYYGIHVNNAFVDFINQNDLRTAEKVHNASDRLIFQAGGIVEFKSAWQWVEGATSRDDAELKNFIATQAWVPTISQVTDPATGVKEIVEDRDHAKLIWVRLLALHVVFTLPGHPEFVWATFEHTASPDNDVNGNPGLGSRDVAPLDQRFVNPTLADALNAKATEEASPNDHILYKGHTQLKDGNRALREDLLTVDAAGQKFMASTGDAAQTSVYRMFPGSKSNTTHPDDAITSLNFNVQTLFKDKAPTDRRVNYRLVGAQWLDKPRYFALDSKLQNEWDNSARVADIQAELADALRTKKFGDTPLVKTVVDPTTLTTTTVPIATMQDAFEAELLANGSDSDWSITAGEDRLSSVAMESFTQQPGSFQNCFTCHNTQAIQSQGVPCKAAPSGGSKLIDAKMLNVSHILSQFLLEECTGPMAARPTWCGQSCTQ